MISTIYKFIMAVIFGFLFGIILLACNSFGPIVIKDQPQECNDMYTLMDFSSRMSGIFSKENTSAATALTLMTLSYSDCKKAREDFKKQIRFDDCKKMIYGPVLLPKEENYKRYADFLECQK